MLRLLKQIQPILVNSARLAILCNHCNFDQSLPSFSYVIHDVITFTSCLMVTLLTCVKGKYVHLLTKGATMARAVQFPHALHKRGGKLFCVSHNIVVEHTRKSLIEKHFSTTPMERLRNA